MLAGSLLKYKCLLFCSCVENRKKKMQHQNDSSKKSWLRSSENTLPSHQPLIRYVVSIRVGLTQVILRQPARTPNQGLNEDREVFVALVQVRLSINLISYEAGCVSLCASS